MSKRFMTVAAPLVAVSLITGLVACSPGPGPSSAVVVGEKPSLDVLALPSDTSIDEAVKMLPDIIDRVLEQTNVPGMSVAVVHGGEKVFAEGYGVTEIGKQGSVTPDTVFQIASLSKPLSATGISAAIKESDGALGWDTKIHALMPDFEYSDPMVTANATVGDAFSHRTGFATGSGDDLEDLGYDVETILERLRLQPLDTFRTSYHYSNFGLTIGAEAVAESRGQTWGELMDELVFGPIGMDSTSTQHDDFLAHEDRARLHALIDGVHVAAFDRNPDAEAPAGGVSSTANDLAKWLNVLLNDGNTRAGGGGVQITDPDALIVAMNPQIVTSHPSTATERPSHYGFGFNANPLLSGRMAASHSGAFSMGAGTAFEIVPELDLGIVALTNGAPVGAPEAVIAEFTDLVQFGESTRDWTTDLGIAFANIIAPVGDLVGEVAPEGAVPPTSQAELLGSYQNDYFGELQLEEREGVLFALIGPDGNTELELQPWEGDVMAYAPSSENAPYGSLASATFDRAPGQISLTLNSFDASGLGTWTKSNP